MDLELDLQDDFNLSVDYKEAPCIPNGTHQADVTQAAYNGESKTIDITVRLKADEDKVCSDGETPVNGQELVYKIYLPQPGDESTMTSSGKQTKRQWKINNMKKTFDALGIQADTVGEISQALEEGAFLREDVLVTTKNDTYQGSVFTRVNAIALKR